MKFWTFAEGPFRKVIWNRFTWQGQEVESCRARNGKNKTEKEGGREGGRQRMGERRSSEGGSSFFIQPLMLTGSHVKSKEVKRCWFSSSSLGHVKVKLIIHGFGGPGMCKHSNSHIHKHTYGSTHARTLTDTLRYVSTWSAICTIYTLEYFYLCLWYIHMYRQTDRHTHTHTHGTLS